MNGEMDMGVMYSILLWKKTTDFPRKRRPSITALTFFQPILDMCSDG